MEYLIIPVNERTNRQSNRKLNTGQLKVVGVDIEEIERKEGGPQDIDDALLDAIKRHFGHPGYSTRYLIVPLEEANVLTLQPKVDQHWSSFTTYLDL